MRLSPNVAAYQTQYETARARAAGRTPPRRTKRGFRPDYLGRVLGAVGCAAYAGLVGLAALTAFLVVVAVVVELVRALK